jgi:hypothetical protein
MSVADRSSLNIYLEDHRAGAVAGKRLAARVRNRNPEYPELARIAAEVAEDCKTLDRVLKQLAVRGGWMKQLVAFAVQLVALLRGAVGKSPAIQVLELETLISGVTAKGRLWVALEPFQVKLQGIDLNHLSSRASSQLATLELVHRTASRRALSQG